MPRMLPSQRATAYIKLNYYIFRQEIDSRLGTFTTQVNSDTVGTCMGAFGFVIFFEPKLICTGSA